MNNLFRASRRAKSSQFLRRSLQVGFWISLFLAGLIATATAQLPRSPIDPVASPLRQIENTLPALSKLLKDDSQITRGVIRLDGYKLFTIAIPVLQTEPEAAENPAPVESRVGIIEKRLQRIIERGFEPDSLKVESELDRTSRQPVVYVSYVRQSEDNRDELFTVTALDAEINGTSSDSWAEEISQVVEDALITAQAERQPQFLRQQALWAAAILVAIGSVSWSLSHWQRQLHQAQKQLAAQSQATKEELSAAQDSPTASNTALMQQRTANQQERRFNDIKWRLSQLGQLLIWGLGGFFLVGLFPYSRGLQPLMLRWVEIPIRLLLLLLFIYVAIRLSEVAIDRLFWALQSSTSLATDTSQRLMLRFTTFSRVTKSIMVLTWGIVGFLLAVSTLGIAINPALLTIAGIIGVGISLASQNLIKDVLNGFLILLEDQYGVGDVIRIGEMSGFVENMNLRITQLRSTEGHLITIPNSSITVVQNLSKEWSRVDLSISVGYEADLDQALAVIEAVAQTMSQDAAWREVILETPQVLGVDNLDYAGATIRLWIKTQPLRQWEVAREYRRRLKLAFDQADIPIGIPQQSLWLSNASEADHPGQPFPTARKSK